MVKTNRGYILLACQAKITYRTGNYRSFLHEVRGIPQIDLLRNYAQRNGGIGQYLLYNFVPDYKLNREFLDLDENENYGITHVSADEIYQLMEDDRLKGEKWKAPGFNNLHPGKGYPFHVLICSLLDDDEPFDDFFPATGIDKLTYYKEEDVVDADRWQEITSPAKIGYIEPEFITQFEKEEKSSDKAPMQTRKV